MDGLRGLTPLSTSWYRTCHPRRVATSRSPIRKASLTRSLVRLTTSRRAGHRSRADPSRSQLPFSPCIAARIPQNGAALRGGAPTFAVTVCCVVPSSHSAQESAAWSHAPGSFRPPRRPRLSRRSSTGPRNFVVEAPDQQIAEHVGQWAEHYRKEKAIAVARPGDAALAAALPAAASRSARTAPAAPPRSPSTAAASSP